jgi:queuosine precursor transporter
MSKIQKLDLLLAFYITAIVCSELLGGKIFTLFHINASVAIFLYPLTFAIDDIVSEVYGKERARSFVKTGFIILVFLFGFTLLSTSLHPAARFQQANSAYISVFSVSLRIIVASLTAFWLSERFDVFIFSKMRQLWGKNKLWARSNISNFLGQFVDTVLFMFLAFYVPGNASFIVSLIIPYYILKCVMSVIETPLTYWGIYWLRKEKNSKSHNFIPPKAG